MAARFWLPHMSTWLAPMTTWRLPDHTMSKIVRYGDYVSMTFGASGTPTGIVAARSAATVSVIISSGSNVAASQPAADDRHGADRVAEDLAVAAERLGQADDADLVEVAFSQVTHRQASSGRRWP